MSQTHYRIIRMAGRDVVHTRMVAIGSAYVPPPARVEGRDALHLQAALLEPRTAKPATGWRAAFGRVWKWL